MAIIGDRGIPAMYSGFSTLTEQMAVRLVKEYNFDVTVYCRRNYYDDRPSYYRGVKCVYLSAPGGKSFESIIHSNFSILHAAFCGYDIALVLDPGNGPFVLPLKFARTPVLIHTDGMGWKRKKWSPLQQKYYKWSEKISALLADWLVTDSKAMQTYYEDEYRAKSTFIPYAGKIGDGLDESILAQHGLTADEYYLCVARIEPDNNVDLIIREYRAANLSKPLVVVGAARYDTEYGRAIAAENYGNVKCIGSVYEKNQLNALLLNAYVYIHGHEVGGTNPSLLNAIHMSAAPLALNVIFHRQVLGDGGLFFVEQAGALAATLKELDANPERVQQQRVYVKARSDQYYRWDAVVDAYAKLASAMVDRTVRESMADGTRDHEFYDPLSFYEKNSNESSAGL
jgi:glycosyltransferase involved in cell wall biosynthesis